MNTSNVATTSPGTVHEDTDNPWAHASVRTPILSMGEKLWAAIKPCWQDHGQAPSSFRLVLDEQGRVQTMTDLEGGEALANPKVQALAHAALACAPYDRLVQGGGSYLIVASE